MLRVCIVVGVQRYVNVMCIYKVTHVTVVGRDDMYMKHAFSLSVAANIVLGEKRYVNVMCIYKVTHVTVVGTVVGGDGRYVRHALSLRFTYGK